MKRNVLIISWCILFIVISPVNASLWKLLTAAYDSSGNSARVRIDAATSSLNTVSYDHHEIHSGSSYHAHYEHEVSGDTEMVVIAFNTSGTAKWVHVVAAAAVTNQSRLSIIESPSIDVDEGTQLTVYNRNRNSTNTSLVTSIETAPVVNKATSFDDIQAASANISTTTILDSIVVGTQGGASPQSMGIGGLSRGSQEWILDQGVQYAFMVENLSAHANVVTLEINWYEHTNHNN